MKPFKAPIDDILFCLAHVAGANELPFWDLEIASEIGAHFATFAEVEIAPLDVIGDQQGCQLIEGRVFMPTGFKEVYREHSEQGWSSLTAPEDYGGQGLGALELAITSEIFSGANHSLQMVMGLVPGAVRTLMRFGTDNQKSRYIPLLASGEALATMCLTESGAGSDLSRVKCAAVQTDKAWQISGEKIFISGGDQDMSKNILHLVLARSSSDGIKGLSLFLCPSTRQNGERNGVSVARIEEKMGLHASPTCYMIFEDAQAELIGQEGDGLKAMFTMMNHARIDVALQGVAHAARAFDIASSYAAERVQGRSSENEPVTLDQHADVRRMIDEIDGLAMTGRALAHLACVEMEKGDATDLVEFLTPVVKVFCTEAGIRAAETGMQVLGGYGYLREYRLEQTYRDARITAIYEGANGIHEKMLATRLSKGPPREAFERFIKKEGDRFGDDQLTQAIQQWQCSYEGLSKADDPSVLANTFMDASICVLKSIVCARMKSVAGMHHDSDRIKRLYNSQQI